MKTNLKSLMIKSLLKEILKHREIMLYHQVDKYCNQTGVFDAI